MGAPTANNRRRPLGASSSGQMPPGTRTTRFAPIACREARAAKRVPRSACREARAATVDGHVLKCLTTRDSAHASAHSSAHASRHMPFGTCESASSGGLRDSSVRACRRAWRLRVGKRGCSRWVKRRPKRWPWRWQIPLCRSFGSTARSSEPSGSIELESRLCFVACRGVCTV